MKYVIQEEDKLIYALEFERYDEEQMFIAFHLNLVAGWDYIDPDNSEEQGWISADGFVEDVQTYYVSQYISQETLTDVLEDEGFTFLRKGRAISIHSFTDPHDVETIRQDS